jgi:hypothetical protein
LLVSGLARKVLHDMSFAQKTEGSLMSVTKIDDQRYYIDPVQCPLCFATNTRIIEKAILYCYVCGEFSDPYDSPSVKAAIISSGKAAVGEVEG